MRNDAGLFVCLKAEKVRAAFSEGPMSGDDDLSPPLSPSTFGRFLDVHPSMTLPFAKRGGGREASSTQEHVNREALESKAAFPIAPSLLLPTTLKKPLEGRIET